MYERVGELQKKEVIDISTGKRLGFVFDVEVDIENGTIGALIVPERNRFLGIFGKYEEHIISYQSIVKVGDDIILVDLQ